jgi:general secretion pathway protein E
MFRQDIDVVLVGEMRGKETIETAVTAAETGHLVFSTLHTNSAPGILTRLINLGISPFLVAATLNIAVAQRLVRKPCTYCMEWVEPDKKESEIIATFMNSPLASQVKYEEKVPKANGCSYCAETGYSGRTAVYEMLPVDDHIKQMIIAGAGEVELYREMRESYTLPTLRDDGIYKVLNGFTTLEELESICSLNYNHKVD